MQPADSEASRRPRIAGPEVRTKRSAPMQLVCALLAGLVLTVMPGIGPAWSAGEAPVPLLSKGGGAVDWWFAFKFNAQKTFAGCGPVPGTRTCIFGGRVQARDRFGQQFAVASSQDSTLTKGQDCLGATTTDPIGATFDQVYNGSFNYVIWNDQFYGDPTVEGCKANSCGAPWGHSKGMLAWNDSGDGFVMQVSTPSWPGSGTSRIRRKAGNTLGCISSNNNLLASQHFFALKLNKADLIKVLEALKNAAVVTDPTKLQIVNNGGPADVQALVNQLGERPKKKDPPNVTTVMLSTGAMLISKSANLTAPPWQMVSALLDGAKERTATWWTKPWIYTTTKSSKINCWPPPLETSKKSGPVAIALTGTWDDQEIKLAAPSNHAKIGVSASGPHRYVIFGDLNQQGALVLPDCGKSQNGRGGLFFVLDNEQLFDSVSALIDGDTAPTKAKP
jgi:hypothetical protein